MLLKSKGTLSTEDSENKLLIEKWMKRNSSTRVTIGQDIVKKNDSSNEKKIKSHSPDKANLTFSTTKKNVVPPKIPDIKSNLPTCTKRPHQFSSDKVELSIAKVLRKSLPTDVIEVQKINSNTLSKIVGRKSEPIAKSKTLISKVSSYNNPIKTSANQSITNKINIPISSAIKTNVIKSNSVLKTGLKNFENNPITKNNVKSFINKDKDTDVYSSLLENYRYLITPKSWSVTEYMNDQSKDRYIVFFNAQVIKENDTLISVMKKSLIIDKGATMNYSVNGLPVNIEGTILPKILDNTKKLLSILHIFDKMQVCSGLGDDLNIMQTDFVFKDNCRLWRHKHCKIVLIKITRCSVCSETRTLVLNRKSICEKDPLNSSAFIGTKLA